VGTAQDLVAHLTKAAEYRQAYDAITEFAANSTRRM
jgi:hypothetical protein